MAFIGYDDKLDPNKAQAQSGGQDPSLSGGTGTAIANSSGGTSGSQQTGTGGDLGSPWVNIQSYLGANQGSTAATDQLNKRVGGALQDEKQELGARAQATKTQADQASTPPAFSGLSGGNGRYQLNNDYITQAGSLYGTNNPQYQGMVSNARNYLNSQYQGPQAGSFGYGFGEKNAQADDYYRDLQNTNDQSLFNELLPRLYEKEQGGAIGSGQKALQYQLDINNPNVRSKRDELLNQYKGFVDNDLSQTKNDVNSYLGQAQTKFDSGKNAFSTGLQFAGSNRREQLQQAAQEAEQLRQRAAANEDERKAYYDRLTGKLKENPYQLSTGGFVTQYPAGYEDFVNQKVAEVQNEYAPNAFDRSFTTGNVAGYDDQRNQYNAILDMLGLTGQVQREASPYDLGLVRDRANRTYDLADADRRAQEYLSQFFG